MKLLVTMMAAALSFIAAPLAHSQDDGTKFGDKELNLSAYVELLRADIQADKVAIVTQVMDLTDDEATKFWPLYRQYQTELMALNDIKLGVIRDYAKNYDSFTDEKADAAANAILDFEAKRVALKKKYYELIKGALSAKRSVQFFQVENQIQMLLDLQVSAMLPAIK
jgi:hypothetical protein